MAAIAESQKKGNGNANAIAHAPNTISYSSWANTVIETLKSNPEKYFDKDQTNLLLQMATLKGDTATVSEVTKVIEGNKWFEERGYSIKKIDMSDLSNKYSDQMNKIAEIYKKYGFTEEGYKQAHNNIDNIYLSMLVNGGMSEEEAKRHTVGRDYGFMLFEIIGSLSEVQKVLLQGEGKLNQVPQVVPKGTEVVKTEDNIIDNLKKVLENMQKKYEEQQKRIDELEKQLAEERKKSLLDRFFNAVGKTVVFAGAFALMGLGISMIPGLGLFGVSLAGLGPVLVVGGAVVGAVVGGLESIYEWLKRRKQDISEGIQAKLIKRKEEKEKEAAKLAASKEEELKDIKRRADNANKAVMASIAVAVFGGLGIAISALANSLPGAVASSVITAATTASALINEVRFGRLIKRSSEVKFGPKTENVQGQEASEDQNEAGSGVGSSGSDVEAAKGTPTA